MPAGDRTLITIATYNEIQNLPRLVDALRTVVPNADLLVIDDNSPDGTGRWCDEQPAGVPLVCLHRPAKLGLGSAIVAGLRYAIDHDYDFALNMDADFSHDPHCVPDMLAAMAGQRGEPVDVAIGSRYVRGGRTAGWPWWRRAMSRSVNLYARCMLGLAPRDVSGGLRCYRVALLKRLDFTQVRARGYAFQEEILWHLKRAGARFAEVPVTFTDRRFGQSKINHREALAALWIIGRLGIRHWIGV